MIKILLLLSLFICSRAIACHCEAWADSPVFGPGRFQELLKKETMFEDEVRADVCRDACVSWTIEQFDEENWQLYLAPIWEKLMTDKRAGYICASDTVFKMPVKVLAKTKHRSFGEVYRQMIFSHRSPNCYDRD